MCYSLILTDQPSNLTAKDEDIIVPLENPPAIECTWLFALCAAVDADTCTALRSLLRKCASIRAGKA
ncbi:hypothetical protein P8452_05581 [Trifolium repens]|jgi:hypothetical protein|nr:hypothetical protein P8452_05581 [Trifolium repens]